MSCPEQYMPALANADRIRLARAASKREILAGALPFSDALVLECWQSATVRALLMALPHIGESKSMEILRKVRIGPARLVRELTSKQSEALVAALPAWTKTGRPVAPTPDAPKLTVDEQTAMRTAMAAGSQVGRMGETTWLAARDFYSPGLLLSLAEPDEQLEVVAKAIQRLSHSAVGADRDGAGYAVYFYENPHHEGPANELLKVGGFPTIEEAIAAKWRVRAQAVIAAYRREMSAGRRGRRA